VRQADLAHGLPVMEELGASWLIMSKILYLGTAVLVIALALVAAVLFYSMDKNIAGAISVFLQTVGIAAVLGTLLFLIIQAKNRLSQHFSNQQSTSQAPRQVGCLFGVMWVVGTALGAAIPGWLSLLVNQPSFLIFVIPAAAIVIGQLQASILKRFGFIASSWPQATVIGWSIGFLPLLVGAMALSIPMSRGCSLLIVSGIGLMIGLSIGWKQQSDIQTWCAHSRWWLVANSIGLASAFGMAEVIFWWIEDTVVHSEIAHGDWAGLAIAGTMVIATIAIVPAVVGAISGLVSGTTLIWLLRHPTSQHE
jgi:hypothetical protein